MAQTKSRKNDNKMTQNTNAKKDTKTTITPTEVKKEFNPRMGINRLNSVTEAHNAKHMIATLNQINTPPIAVKPTKLTDDKK